jgi:hypothetical protein
MGSIPSSDSRELFVPGGPSVTQAEPSWSVGSGVPRFVVPVTTSPGRAPCAVDRHVHRGSAPRVSHPLGGFLANPGFAALGPTSPWSVTCRCRSGPSPLQGSTRRNRASLPGPLAPSSFGVAARSGAVIDGLAAIVLPALRPIACPDLPGLPLTPAAFRPTLTEAPGLLPCVLVCGRPRRGGQSPSRARATFLHGQAVGPRHPQARRTVLTLASLRRPRSVLPPACPTPFLEPLSRAALDSWVVTFVGFVPSRASLRLQASGPD